MSDGGSEPLAVKVGKLEVRVENAEKIADTVASVDKKVDALSDKITRYQNKLTIAVGLFMAVLTCVLGLPSAVAALKVLVK